MTHFIFRPLASLTFSVIFGSVSLLSACDKKATTVPADPLEVSVIKVSPSNETFWVQTLGETEGTRQVEIRPQVSGILTAIRYQEGHPVKAGDILFEIEKDHYKATLDSARAAYNEAKANFNYASSELRRNKKLYNTKAVSQKTLNDAIKAERVALAAMNNSKAKLADAQINYNYTEVKAPSDGVAGKAEVNLGSLVNTSSTLLTTLTQPGDLRVKFQLSERDIAGEPITTSNKVRVYDSKGNTLEATMDYVSQQVDVTTSTRALRAKLTDTKTLCPGELVRVQFGIRNLTKVFRVPQKAVIQKPDGSYELYLAQDNKVKSVKVKVGQWESTDWIILEGLKGNETIIVNQLQRIREGASIKAKLIDKSEVR